MIVTSDVVGLNEVRKLLNDMPEHLFENTKKEFSSSLLSAQEAITMPMSIGQYGLQSRSSNLAKSIKFDTKGTTLATLSSSLFTKNTYAKIHEVGGTIKGIDKFLGLGRGPLLSIPTSLNKTPKGVTRMTPRQVFNAGGSIGMAYVALGGTLRPRMSIILNGEAMYTFASQVTIKPSLKMRQRVTEQVPTLLSSLNNSLLDGM